MNGKFFLFEKYSFFLDFELFFVSLCFDEKPNFMIHFFDTFLDQIGSKKLLKSDQILVQNQPPNLVQSDPILIQNQSPQNAQSELT